MAISNCWRILVLPVHLNTHTHTISIHYSILFYAPIETHTHTKLSCPYFVLLSQLLFLPTAYNFNGSICWMLRNGNNNNNNNKNESIHRFVRHTVCVHQLGNRTVYIPRTCSHNINSMLFTFSCLCALNPLAMIFWVLTLFSLRLRWENTRH